MMNYLIYVSTAARPLNNSDLGQILLESRKKYNMKGITGMMLYSNGTIFQALEGEAEQLEQLFEGIQHDDRQKGVIKLKSGKEASRMFSDWSMGVKASYNDFITKISGFVDPLRYDFLESYNPDHPAVKLLRSFAEYNLQY
ncbi:BLUF domain-containing protein [uncultured Mucilaginibacter sp.]|uniref:BLUF domain-containing protein n=2 Tax=uncultured Mucilaginibacter sp. TaxID=797541 RepID=UPI00343E69E8